MYEYNENGTPKGVPGARGKKKLTPEQEAALHEVSHVDDIWRQAKSNARIELKRAIEERIGTYARDRDRAVWDAIQLGIPKSRITKDGLRTSSPNVIYEIEDRMRRIMPAPAVDVLAERYRSVPREPSVESPDRREIRSRMENMDSLPMFWCMIPRVYKSKDPSYDWSRIAELVAEDGGWVRVASNPNKDAFSYGKTKLGDEFLFEFFEVNGTIELWMKKKMEETK